MTRTDWARDDLEARLRRHVRHLAGEIGERNVWRSSALAEAARYIRGEWERMGYTVASQTYEVGETSCENLEVVIQGVRHPKQIVLAGAHYDSVRGSPGANDNASGVAGLLEIGRLLHRVAPARSVKLVAFVNEEPPFFHSDEMGSGIYARAARDRADDIRLMFSLEMLGCYSAIPGSQAYPPLLRFFYPDRGEFIALVSNLGSRRQLRQATQAFKSSSDFPCESLAAPSLVPGVAWSDQLSFWRAGYPALMVTDTAFYRYPHYHSARDTPEKLAYAQMTRVVAGLAGMLAVLADAASI